MMSTVRVTSIRFWAAALLAVAAAGCTVQEQKAPPLSGPSELGLALAVNAAPETLPRDGSSMSTITVRAFDSNGKQTRQRVLLSATAGTLSATDFFTTDADPPATVTFVAPGINERVSFVTIIATPIGVKGGDAAVVNDRTTRIEVRGPSIPFADFFSSPSQPAVLDSVTFDATGSSLDGSNCGSGCSYAWNFGDGSNGSGLVVQHGFSTSGVFNVTLTVTSLAFGTTNSVTNPVVIAPPAPPVADFTLTPSVPTAGANITFRSLSTVGAGATIVSHVWDLDNGTPPVDSGSSSTYVLVGGYPAMSSHAVTLTVTDSLGRTSVSAPRMINIP